MILNVGCGGRSYDKACYFEDVRIDVKRFPSVMILMDAHSLGFRGSVFDKIVCFEVLEHLDSPIRVLHIAFKKKCPQIIIVYSLIRLAILKASLERRKISLETHINT